MAGFPPTFDWEAASGRAYQAMKPSVGSDLNVTVFLAELGDLDRMFKLYDQRHGFLKNLASGHLNYNFGWKPFVRDLKEIISRAVDWQTRLGDFLKRENTPQVRHYGESLGWNSTFSQTYSSAPQGCRKTITLNLQKYSATMKYRYSIPQMSGLEQQVRGFLDAFGLARPASTLWELIPFSFVVDWFVNVGGFIRSNERDWLEPVLNITDFCHSIKYTYSGKEEFQRGLGSWATSVTTESSVYRRYVSVPNMRGDFDADGLNARRVLLSTSLLIANSRRGS